MLFMFQSVDGDDKFVNVKNIFLIFCMNLHFFKELKKKRKICCTQFMIIYDVDNVAIKEVIMGH